MDIDLIEASIKYHGKELYDLLARENNFEPSQESIRYTDSQESANVQEKELAYRTESDLGRNDPDDRQLYKRLLKFIALKSDYLFNERFSPSLTTPANDSSASLRSLSHEFENTSVPIEFDLAPIETFMELPSKARKDHLMQLNFPLKYIEPGDLVIGCIDQVNETGIFMNLICFANHKRRDLSRIEINLFCPYHDAVRSVQVVKSNVKQLHLVFSKHDLVRCEIVDVLKDRDLCHVSLVENLENPVKLGTIQPEDMPSYQQNIEFYREEPYTFAKDLKRERAFNNPACVDLLLKKLKLRPTWASNFSLMQNIHNVKIPREEMADSLLKAQNKALALQNVERGIKYFKEDRNIDAMVYFNKALSIDEQTVEAYVARGALFANEGNLDKAIEDFEKALTLDAHHSNAKKYLKEVFLSYSIKMEKRDNYEEAISYLKKALGLDPENELIRNKAKELTRKMDEMYRKNTYGPILPSEATKRSRRSSSSSRSSNSDESEKRSSLHDRSNVTSSSRSSHQDGHGSYSRSISSSASIGRYSSGSGGGSSRQYTANRSMVSDTKTSNSKSYDSNQTAKKSNRAGNDDDDEDLEEFYMKLKQNKASAKK